MPVPSAMPGRRVGSGGVAGDRGRGAVERTSASRSSRRITSSRATRRATSLVTLRPPASSPSPLPLSLPRRLLPRPALPSWGTPSASSDGSPLPLRTPRIASISESGSCWSGCMPVARADARRVRRFDSAISTRCSSSRARSASVRARRSASTRISRFSRASSRPSSAGLGAARPPDPARRADRRSPGPCPSTPARRAAIPPGPPTARDRAGPSARSSPAPPVRPASRPGGGRSRPPAPAGDGRRAPALRARSTMGRGSPVPSPAQLAWMPAVLPSLCALRQRRGRH